jgi:hypothetical protein|tara:strand:+ start:132 stop:239 length:108 start_codon:yes stop_codon:yes gene_type:complete
MYDYGAAIADFPIYDPTLVESSKTFIKDFKHLVVP